MLKELHLIRAVLFSSDWRRMVSSFGTVYSRIENLSAGKCQGILLFYFFFFSFHSQLFNRVFCLVLGAQKCPNPRQAERFNPRCLFSCHFPLDLLIAWACALEKINHLSKCFNQLK